MFQRCGVGLCVQATLGARVPTDPAAIQLRVASTAVADTATMAQFLLPKRSPADNPTVPPISVYSPLDPVPGPVAVPAADAPQVPDPFRCIPDHTIVRVEDVVLSRLLGRGSYGEVYLAEVAGRGPRVLKVPAVDN